MRPSESFAPRRAEQELLGDTIRDVLEFRMHWVVRHGNAVLLGLAGLLLAFAWGVQYPDIIQAPVKVVASNPPRFVSAKVTGQLGQLFVANGDVVRAGQYLGYLESTTSYAQATCLRAWIDTVADAMTHRGMDGILGHPIPEVRDLGPIETSYQDLRTELAQARQMLANGYFQHKRQMLEQELVALRQVKTSADRQAQLAQQDVQLQAKEYQAYETLSTKYEVSPLQLNQYKSKLLAKEQALQQSQSQLHSSDLTISAKAMELLDLDKTIADQQQRTATRLFEVKSQLDAWVQQYVLVAPADGAVSFVSTIHDHLSLDAGQGLFYIQPRQSQLYAEVTAAERGVGKIHAGQQVMIKVESYPAEEFGYVTGSVQEIANLANRSDSFFVKVGLPQGLQTNTGKIIAFRNGLTGHAEIVTDRRRLADRLLGQITQLVRR